MNHKLVFWKQGMLLKPHHLQHADITNSALNWKIWQRNNIYPWGVLNVSFDYASFANGLIVLNEFEAIFPDGTWVKKDENALIRSCRFNPALVFPNSNYMVYIGIKKLFPNQVNVTYKANDDVQSVDTRFICNANGEDITNMYESDVAANVQTMSYVLRLFTQEQIEELAEYIVIPIAALQKNNTGIILNEEYIPPITRISSSPIIYKIVAEIYDQIKRGIYQLDSYKMKDTDSSTSELGESLNYLAPILVKYRLALQILSKYLMQLKHALNEEATHPWHIFNILQELIAELTSFTTKVSILALDSDDNALSISYDHFDFGNVLIETQKLLRTLLDEIVVSDELNIPMTKEGTSSFTVVLPEKFFKLNNRFYMVVLTQSDPKKWIEDFKSFARIAAISKVSLLASRSLPGLKFSHFPDTPPGLPARQNAYYFVLDQSSNIWQDIYTSRSLAVIWDATPEDCKIDLSVVEG